MTKGNRGGGTVRKWKILMKDQDYTKLSKQSQEMIQTIRS